MLEVVMHFCEQHTLYSFDPFVVIIGVYLGLYSPSLLWPLLPGPLRLQALAGNMAKALAIVALYPLATLGTSVCSTNIHRCTAAQWSARRGSVIVGTKVLGWSCHINQEELLSPPYCVHCSYHLFPRFSQQAPHVYLLQDFLLDCPFEQVLSVLIWAGRLHLQGLELGQEIIYPLAGALSKMQELGPCPFLVVPWEEEILDLCLEICPRGPSVGCHALIEANLCIMACTRPFQT